MEAVPEKLHELSPLGQYVYSFAKKYNVIDFSLNYLNTEPEKELDFLFGSRLYDFCLCFLFAFMMPFIRKFLVKRIYEPLGMRILGRQGEISPKTLSKWTESCWKLTGFTTFSTLAFFVSYGEVWFTDSRYWWLGCTHFPPCNLPVSRGLLLYYCFETGFYMEAINFLIFHETRRRDWAESLIHHIATSILLLYSYYVNFTRVGVVVLLIHDFSDIFLEASKLAKYARAEILSVALFVVFLISWIVCRCVIFPLFVIRSTLFEPVALVAVHIGVEPRPHFEIFNCLLILLFILHIYWTWIIIKILLRLLVTGNADDVREKEEVEETKVVKEE
uniref:TLC domain-containing protein n=1 Tax=Polytomella parva TaxID=51329 RepID=A0A7S0YMV2_9CHLO|mmetsp:Transcript_33760/g.60949  ORF Transcript_33760/g.60949 Transcript_33760/m.60949 type:complete len:332 (+) Transcript_33760:69-1064(+)